MIIKRKKTQSEIITVVLLILIAIAAVVLVSTFVLKIVKNNLKDTDCFETAGQLTIDLEDQYTYFDSPTQKLYLSIKRGDKEFSLTGIRVIITGGGSSESHLISETKPDSDIKMYNPLETVSLPGSSETKTYIISLSFDSINKVRITPLISENTACEEGADERAIN